MTITTQRASKPLKLFRAVGYVCLWLGGIVYLLDGSRLGFYSVLSGAALLLVSRLLIWWFHG